MISNTPVLRLNVLQGRTGNTTTLIRYMENIKHAIIIRYLQGDPTEEEKRIFLSWVNASPDNKKAYFELKAIFDAAKVEAAPIDIGASWRRLAAKRERSVCRRTLTFRRAISYAAVITLTLTISIFITRRGHEPDTIQSRYVSGDGNTSNNVILPDGTTVHLGPHTTF